MFLSTAKHWPVDRRRGPGCHLGYLQNSFHYRNAGGRLGHSSSAESDTPDNGLDTGKGNLLTL